jgi:OFA family oxalate/formate antiporter-like MFS transporter
MAIQQKNQNLSYDARSNFGAKGWWIIIFSAMNWYIYSSLTSAPNNVVVPERAVDLGVAQGTLLSLSTPAGILALFFGMFVIGRATKVWGVRITNGLSLILSAGSVILWAFSQSVIVYAVALFLLNCFIAGVEMSAQIMIMNWFPKKKGIAIGWATMGLNFGGATAVAIIAGFAAVFGSTKYGLLFFSGLLFLIAVLNFAAFRDYPEQWNAFPDNNPNEKRREAAKLHTGWTPGKVLRQKETWIMSTGCGIYGMTTIGFVSTLVPSMIMKGFSPPLAVSMMTIACFFGAVGSYLCGFLDQKFGSQKSSLLYGVWVIVGILFFFVPGRVGAFVNLFMFGISLGGSNNYPPSMTAQIFGRDGSNIAFPVVYLIKGVFIFFVYAILGLSLNRTGGYSAGWISILVLVVVGMILFYICDLNPKEDPINASEKRSA